MATHRKSARRFLERIGLVDTSIKPVPVVNFRRLAILNVELKEPLPLVELCYQKNGEPPPDRGDSTKEWPEGTP